MAQRNNQTVYMIKPITQENEEQTLKHAVHYRTHNQGREFFSITRVL